MFQSQPIAANAIVMPAPPIPVLPCAIFTPILPTEPEDHDQTIHRVPVNGLIVILRFYG